MLLTEYSLTAFPSQCSTNRLQMGKWSTEIKHPVQSPNGTEPFGHSGHSLSFPVSKAVAKARPHTPSGTREDSMKGHRWMFLKENVPGTWSVPLGGSRAYGMARDRVAVTPWTSVVLWTSHVTSQVSACGACLPYWLWQRWGSSLSWLPGCSWVSCGIDWGRMGPLVPLSLCLFLCLLVLGGQRASGVGLVPRKLPGSMGVELQLSLGHDL